MRFKTAAPFLSLLLLAIIALFIPTLPNFDEGKYNLADIAWILVATALVFLMTPGLAFFYGGMVNRKNVLSTMMKRRWQPAWLAFCGSLSGIVFVSARVFMVLSGTPSLICFIKESHRDLPG